MSRQKCMPKAILLLLVYLSIYYRRPLGAYLLCNKEWILHCTFYNFTIFLLIADHSWLLCFASTYGRTCGEIKIIIKSNLFHCISYTGDHTSYSYCRQKQVIVNCASEDVQLQSWHQEGLASVWQDGRANCRASRCDDAWVITAINIVCNCLVAVARAIIDG